MTNMPLLPNGYLIYVDALELVDWRSGEIRDRAINEWLLEETLTAMSDIDHPRVQKWVKTLRRHQSQLLTSLDWLATSLQPYREQLAQVVADRPTRIVHADCGPSLATTASANQWTSLFSPTSARSNSRF